MQFEVSRSAVDKDGYMTKYFKKGFIDDDNVVHVTEEKGTEPELIEKNNDPTHQESKFRRKCKFIDEDNKFIKEYENKLRNINEKEILMKSIESVKLALKSRMESELSETLLIDYKTICAIRDELGTFRNLSKKSKLVLAQMEEIYVK